MAKKTFYNRKKERKVSRLSIMTLRENEYAIDLS